MSWPEVQQYSGRTDLFGSVAAHANETAGINTGDATAPSTTVRLTYTTSHYFRVLNVQPALGTEPAAEPDVTRLATSPTAMINHAMWQQRFGGARDVVGRMLRINAFPVEIVGVTPRRFTGTDGGGGATIWVPLAAYPVLQKRTQALFSSSDSLFLRLAAQLRPGTTTSAAAPATGRHSATDTSRAPRHSWNTARSDLRPPARAASEYGPAPAPRSSPPTGRTHRRAVWQGEHVGTGRKYGDAR